MQTPLCESETVWGGIYALFHFFAVPSLFSFINRFLLLPNWAVNVCITFLNALCSLVIYRHFLWDSWKAALRQFPKLLLYIGAGLLLYFGANVLYLWGVEAVYPSFFNRNDAQISALLSAGGLPMILAVVIAAPIGEELIFRGLLFRGLYDRSPIAAWCASVGLFALIHVAGYLGQYSVLPLILAFFQYIPAGICLALAYRLSGTVFCPIFMHMLINLIGVIAPS